MGKEDGVIEVAERTTWGRRARAVVLLAMLLVTLGLIAAAGVGGTVVLLGSLLDQALE
jgi:hypothetical protein